MRFVVFLSIILSLFHSTSALSTFDHQYQAYAKLLKTYVVKEGAQTLVDYQSLKENKRDLEKVTILFSSLDKKQFESLSKNQKLAFLINTYNLFTLKLIVDNYPLKSIKDIGSFFSGPWSKPIVTILGEKYTLDNIEHDMIRRDFKEPRIHFAVNCASIGCPSLYLDPFTAEKIDSQLEEAATNFLKNREKNYFDSKEKKLYLSKIFKWYGSDWEKMTGKPFLTFIKRILKEIPDQEVKTSFLEYDWSLNEKRQ